jgi:hypothetical protein
VNDSRRWWFATSERATFAFAIDGSSGRVTLCAPYGRKMIAGAEEKDALRILSARGFEVQELR